MDLRAETADWPVGSAGVAVLDASGVRAILDDGSAYEFASVTKVLTALTVLDAWADGTIDLDAAAGPPGSTVRNLLAHASGLPFEGYQPIGRPGSKRVYSNTGYVVLADELEKRAGGSFTDELVGRVLGPLGMSGTRLVGSASSGASGTLADLIALAQELLVPSVLGPEIIGAASTVAFPGLAGVLPGFGRQAHNDWGLGCEIRSDKAPHWTSAENSPATFGHFGQSGSFVWVDPAAGLACVSLCDTRFGPWATTFWPRLSTRVLESYG